VNAITQLDILDLEDTISRYDVGELVRYWPAANGIENSNYFIRTVANGREHDYVLTILEQPSNSGGAYVPLLDLCVEAGLPVARVIKTPTGESFQSYGGKSVLLSQRLPGQHVYNPTQSQIRALGRFLGRLHTVTASWNHPVPPYPRDANWLEHQAALASGYLPFQSATLLNSGVREMASLLARNDTAALPRGVIHGDLFRDNVLFNSQGLTGVLDFHHAAEGYLIYDLAVAANDWCTDASGQLDPELTFTLLRSYHQLRRLKPAELQLLPAFMLYAALAFWLSRLVVSIHPTGDGEVRCNNPEEFQRIVEQHVAHFLYLDERLLLD
jgi:homoserine kinase type II